ncbi:HLH-domain-containing protein [Cristinia sonorae]|uniref:HLH-domain-containing protein n=1 Tax=Cristinia sonorae TaxID=1940300 RepID=A0A8K0UQU0_9AGAR|nr:HLH-domain-containing protein [Cristinia sonorae]
MSTAFYSAASYKPQVLSRTEGFHLPSPAPSTPPSADSTPGGSSNNNNNNTSSNFDTSNLFVTPPTYLSVPESFRKFPGASSDGSSSMDFTEELASLINNPATSASSGHHHHHPSSHERSTHSPANGYDDYRPHTHNIFDISAPTQHHSHHSSHHQNYAPGSSAFSLPPSSHHASMHAHQSSHHAGSLHNHGSHPLHDFSSHTHFNSTVPAIGSSMRYEPPGSSHGPTSAGGEPSSVSSFNSHISGISNFSNITTTSESYHNGHIRQTPSPVSGQAEFGNRSRSRSRASTNGAAPADPANPPSTNGGPARRTRTKRNSVSSVSPPPLQRHAQPLVIPGSNGAANGRGPASPLSLHTNGWFIPTNNNQQAGEFSLPTPESVHGGFSNFTNPLGVSPKDVNGLVLNNVGGVGIAGPGLNGMNGGGVTTVSMKGESPPGDMATKQAMLANEKRRRRRESHNAVERRRRDNINEKISELATLIPECLLDPSATPSSALATNDDGLLSPTSPVGGFDGEDDKDSGKDGKDSGKDGKESGAVKANKGMILRKSVEYIRYLQELVSAQASRNRDLEQQLQTYRSGGIPTPPSGSSSTPLTSSGTGTSGEDDMGLLLHDEVDLSNLPSSSSSSSSPSSSSKHKRSQSSTKKFNGFELESVEEMDMEEDCATAGGATKHFTRSSDDADEDMDRPSTMGGMSMSLSPSASASGSFDGDEEGSDKHEHDEQEEEEEEGERGRKSRREMEVKVKQENGMEMS